MVGMILKAGLFIGVCNGVRLDNWTFREKCPIVKPDPKSDELHDNVIDETCLSLLYCKKIF